MPEALSSRFRSAHPAFIPYAIAALSGLLTLSAMLYVRRVTLTSNEARASSLLVETQQSLQARLDSSLAALRTAADFIQVNPKLTQAQFRRLTQQLELEQRYVGIRDLGFVKYQASRRKQPVLGNNWTIHRVAFERARDTGLATVSGRRGSSSNLLLFMPAYTAKAPTGTMDQRRRALIGFAYATFRGDDLLRSFFNPGSNPRFDYALYDGGQARVSTLLARSETSFKAISPQTRARSLLRLEIAGHPLTLELRPRIPFAFSGSWFGPFFVGLSGFVTSWFLFILLRSRERLMQSVKEKCMGLEQANEELHRRLSELETLIRVMPLGIGVSQDPSCQTITGNPSLAHLLGVEPDTLIALDNPQPGSKSYRFLRNGNETFPVDKLPMSIAARLGEEVRDVECDVERADGTRRHLLCNAMPLFNPDGSVRGSLGVFTDITGSHQAEEEGRRAKDALVKQALGRIAELHKINQLLMAQVEESTPHKTEQT